MNILLLSTYELGHQPLGLAWPAAHLRAAGHQVTCIDLAVEPLDEALVVRAGLVGISVPMHTATRLGVRVAERVRRLNPSAHISFYGLYASLHADLLLGRLADSVVGGEVEAPLTDLANRISSGFGHGIGGVGEVAAGGVFLGRQQFERPARDLLPPLDRYARLDDGSRQKLAGYVEASRGCAHRCLHCPITPIYGGRLRVVPTDVVLDDIRQLVALGAEHITFGDPDFFNGVKHSLRIVQALRSEFPGLTYDATIKVEHLLEHRDLLPLLTETGCAFVVSAVESLENRVLSYLRKGHSAEDVEMALDLAAAAGLVVRPTFVAFTPWTTLDGYLRLFELVERRGLIRHVDPVQYTIRLLVPRGSSLLGTDGVDGLLGPFDPDTLTYTWTHVDPRLDALQQQGAALVEAAGCDRVPVEITFQRLKTIALEAAGRPSPPVAKLAVATGSPVPRLTEAWFC